MIRVYNTLSRQKEDFHPLHAGKVGIYCCGPTVYKDSHVGHMVGPVIFDAVKRYLEYSGFTVSLVINVTDVDDKIIVQAAKEGCTMAALAERVTADYMACLDRLAVRVDHFPRATAYMSEILTIIQGLMDKGMAYASGGDVYFEVTKDEDYGKLSNRRIEELYAGVRKEVSDLKRHPGDFALWKGAKPGEPSWESPWGPGRPGWHIECSAMSMKLLGTTFDIHGGGLDLCFPHHEDEIAQSESYSGQPFAKYWMHNGLMQRSQETAKLGGRGEREPERSTPPAPAAATTDGEARMGDLASQEDKKMSKSKGNTVTARDLITAHGAETLRFFLLSTHYRRPIDFSSERVTEVGRGLAKFHGYAERFQRITGQDFYSLPAPVRRADESAATDPFLDEVKNSRARFLECMDDDFNTGGAIGVLFELLPLLNRFADEKRLDEAAEASAAQRELLVSGTMVLRELTAVLGVLLAPPPRAAASDNGLTPRLLDLLLDVRNQARKAKQFALADSIRKGLNELGITIEDRADGSRWKLGDTP